MYRLSTTKSQLAMPKECPRCGDELLFECLSCGWVRPGYRDHQSDWKIHTDGTVTMD